MFEEVFAKLEKSAFRRKFKLTDADKQYIETKGYDVIRRHAEDFVKKRLSPPVSQLKNDGKQTPMRGHPVFTAQHACACCCRQCLYKWHRISPDHWLTDAEQKYIVSLLMSWIEKNR